MGGKSAVVSKTMKADIGFSTNAEWYCIFNTVKYLSENGLAVFPVIPAIFYPSKEQKISRVYGRKWFLHRRRL